MESQKYCKNREPSKEATFVNEDASNEEKLKLDEDMTLDKISELAKEHFHSKSYYRRVSGNLLYDF